MIGAAALFVVCGTGEVEDYNDPPTMMEKKAERKRKKEEAKQKKAEEKAKKEEEKRLKTK